jgi:hypothetical protein
VVHLLLVVGSRLLFAHHPMFSPAEYLTNLRQISLLNGLVTPQGQLPSIPSIPKIQSAPAGIPVVATVPTAPECYDIISAVACSPLAINLAALFAAGLIITVFIKKYGPSILAWFRDKMPRFLASIRSKISKQRTVLLLPASQAVVMG